MTLEEVLHILETEKFNSEFDKMSLYYKIILIKLKKVFSEYFFIPEDTIYKFAVNTRFFGSLITNKPVLDIKKIKLDLYNKVPELALAIKYIEPIEVIREIRDNIDNEVSLLNNKIYTSIELSNACNLSITSIARNLFLNKICIQDKNKSILFWEGNTVLENLDEIAKYTIDGLKINTTLIPLLNLYKHMDGDPTGIREKIRRGDKIFDVDLSYAFEDRVNTSSTIFIKKEDYKKIVSNKKYYIKMEDAKKVLLIPSGSIKTVVVKYYEFIYKDILDLRAVYVKKDVVSKLLEIIKTYEYNYCLFIDNFYKHIQQNYQKINIKVIFSILTSKDNLNRVMENNKIKLINGFINKKDALFLIDHIRSSSYKYKKSKEQGIKNGKINR